MGTKNNPGAYDCYANAAPDEPMFVLLGRDPAAGLLVKIWVEIRRQMGEDPTKLTEAFDCSNAMSVYAAKLGKQAKIVRAVHALRSIGGVTTETLQVITVANPPESPQQHKEFDLHFGADGLPAPSTADDEEWISTLDDLKNQRVHITFDIYPSAPEAAPTAE